MKALLISIAAFVAFDAAAWQGEVRTKVTQDTIAFAHKVTTMEWRQS